MKALSFAAMTAILMLSTGCASVSTDGYIAPGEKLAKSGHYYIVLSERDVRGLHVLLHEQLSLLGYDVKSGYREDTPDNSDYVVEYDGQWQLDITWYLLNFNIRIYQAESGLLVASGSSYRTSLVRKEPPEVVSETLAQFANK